MGGSARFAAVDSSDGSVAGDASTTEHGATVQIGRYALHRQIARGGMATIHIARLVGDEGFSRIVAAKRLLPELAEDPEFVAMFLDEARIASRVHHRNVVPVLDVVTTQDEVVLVQEYVHGVPLHRLLNRTRQARALVPIDIAISIACQILAGLHAAHETTDELGAPLHVVHRDVSPQNVMIATDGTARLLDFGVAKSLMAGHVTRDGTYKGKLAYSAPEQLRGAAVRQSDIYSLAVLLWELLVGQRMHRTGQVEGDLIATIMSGELPAITQPLVAQRTWESLRPEHRQQLRALEPIVARGLAVQPEDRFQTAVDMEAALLAVVRPASGTAVARWLRSLGKAYLDEHDKVLAAEEASWRRIAGAQAPLSHRRARGPTLPQHPPATRLAAATRPDEPSPGVPATFAGPAEITRPIVPAGPIEPRPAPVPSPPGPAPAARPHVGTYLLVALLSLLVVVLAIGMVVVGRDRGAPAGVAPASVTSPGAAAPSAPAVQPVEPAAKPVERARALAAAAPAAAPGPPIVFPPPLPAKARAKGRAAKRPAAGPPKPPTVAAEPVPVEPPPP